MAKALGLLGGSSSVPSASGGGAWMASLSRTERLGEAACLRLKDAARRVAEIMREAVVESLRRLKLTAEAVKVLRLLVRRDQVKPRSLSLSPSVSSLSLSLSCQCLVCACVFFFLCRCLFFSQDFFCRLPCWLPPSTTTS